MSHPEPTTPTVAIYTRTARLNAAGETQAQVSAQLARAQERGWNVAAVISETRSYGISNLMLEALTAYDVVMTTHAQLGRELLRGRETTQRLRDAGVRVVSHRSGAFSGDIPAGGTADALVVGLEEHASQLHSQRVKAGMAAARARREAQR